MAFIEEIAPHAQSIQRDHGILSSIIIAQAIHESNWGRSTLAKRGKNLFGVKGTYKGQSITLKTSEVYKGQSVYIDAAFRKYPSWYESLEDLVHLYENGVSWDRAKYRGLIGESDYKKAAQAIQEAGYATDPQYANKIIAIIETNGLTKYDQQPSQPKQETKSQPKPFTAKQESPGSWMNPADNRIKANPKPVHKGDQKTKSIVDYLKSIGLDSSMANRTKLAKKYGMSDYTGTAEQNLQLLKRMRG